MLYQIIILILIFHKYTMLCYEKLKELFKNRINLIIGDNRTTLLLSNNMM
jgi:hypothetical protein